MVPEIYASHHTPNPIRLYLNAAIYEPIAYHHPAPIAIVTAMVTNKIIVIIRNTWSDLRSWMMYW